ncbi:MAG: 3-deoxy-7-phosphoheptulonate synthase [Gemmatimonadetes bacterium]|nr:3-deoxy-7-phosphoheptulonate synthase [Gemmatimonadota bacterium]
MLVVMKQSATEAEIARVCDWIRERGYTPQPMPGAQRTAIGLVGNDGRVDGSPLEDMVGVAEVIYVSNPYKQVSREWKPENTLVTIAPGVVFGGRDVPVIAGPCSVENEAQIVASARAVKAAGAVALRGGAFKPRSSPYSFQGLGKKGLELLALAKRETGLAIVTEAMDDEGAHLVAEFADCLQIGARNMQNYSLLKTVGRIGKPVLLKRGMAATIQDLLLSAEYILAEGNTQVILCERGLRSFDTASRNLFDLTAIPIVQQLSHLPIVADPSHGTGRRDKVLPMARAAVAAGADGVIIEVHPQPEKAMSDGAQSQTPDQFTETMRQLRRVADAIGRSITGAALGVLLAAMAVLPARPLQAQSDLRAPAATAPRSDSASLALLERAGKAYKGARTLRAAFTQELVNPRTRTNLRSSGEFFQKGAQLFSFRFSAPAEDRIVSDGQVLWLYSPSTAPGQVFKMPRAAGAGLDLASSVLTEPARRYIVTAAGDTLLDGRPVRGMLLVPRSPNAPFMRATLWLDTENALVRRASFTEASGLVRTVTFTGIRTGSALPRGVFTFTPPEGVRVIDQAAMLSGSVRP